MGELRNGQVREYEIHPEDFGFAMASMRQVRVETPEESRAMLLDVLEGKPGVPSDLVALNAGVALYAANVVDSMAEGVTRAQAAIASGAAKAKLAQLVAASSRLA
jgi:anthranilate phosphoribosyltransferase